MDAGADVGDAHLLPFDLVFLIRKHLAIHRPDPAPADTGSLDGNDRACAWFRAQGGAFYQLRDPVLAADKRSDAWASVYRLRTLRVLCVARRRPSDFRARSHAVILRRGA